VICIFEPHLNDAGHFSEQKPSKSNQENSGYQYKTKKNFILAGWKELDPSYIQFGVNQ
jgi:hypothetical protein